MLLALFIILISTSLAGVDGARVMAWEEWKALLCPAEGQGLGQQLSVSRQWPKGAGQGLGHCQPSNEHGNSFSLPEKKGWSGASKLSLYGHPGALATGVFDRMLSQLLHPYLLQVWSCITNSMGRSVSVCGEWSGWDKRGYFSSLRQQPFSLSPLCCPCESKDRKMWVPVSPHLHSIVCRWISLSVFCLMSPEN